MDFIAVNLLFFRGVKKWKYIFKKWEIGSTKEFFSIVRLNVFLQILEICLQISLFFLPPRCLYLRHNDAKSIIAWSMGNQFKWFLFYFGESLADIWALWMKLKGSQWLIGSWVVIFLPSSLTQIIIKLINMLLQRSA